MKGTHPKTIPARFSVIWFSGFRGEMSSNVNCSYMPRSSLRYILDFSVKLLFQPIYTDYGN
jgi:hypothetical protein